MKKVIFFILLLFCITINVKAEEKVNIHYEIIENVYSNRVVNGQIRSTKGMLITYQNNPIYCIKYGYPISRTGYYKYYISAIDELTDLQKRDIELIMYYGYLYKNHDSIYYYMATQEIIWNILGENIYWTTENNGEGNIIDIRGFKNEILGLYNSHFIRPNIDLSNIDFEVGKEVILEDTNNVLNKYFLMYYGNNVVTKNGNNLNIKPYNIGNDRIMLESNYGYVEESTVFKEEGYQSLIKLGGIAGEFYLLDFDVHETSMIINRVASGDFSNVISDSSLEGVIYNVYDEDMNLLDTVTTDKYGKATVNNIHLGNYILEEINSSKGYIQNNYPFAVSITYGNTPQDVYVNAEVISKNIKITNIYKDGDIYFYESGIVFDIYNADKLITRITTDESGKCNINLDYGEYKIKQVNSKEGYSKLEDFEVIISEGEDNLEFMFTTEKEIKSNDEQGNNDSNNNEIIEEDVIDDNTGQEDDGSNNESGNDEQNETNNENMKEDSESDENIIKELPQLLENKSEYNIFLLFILFLCIRRFCFS